MKAINIILVVAVLAITASRTPALADRTPPAATLLYLDRQGWTQASGELKAALAADFMRVFCGNPAMPVVDLVNCLDRIGETGPIFEHALACIGADPARSAR
jgi:hypothetical protein